MRGAPLLLAALLCACGDRADDPAPATAATPASPYACGSTLAPDAAAAHREIDRSYRDWKEAYLTSRGAGGALRVTMAAKGGDRTTSEAIGYGMLLAAYLDDPATFDALWRYARRYHNPRGLMAWEVSPAGQVGDENAATDGDEDMAFALLVADARWGGYAGDARELIAALWRHAVEPGTFLFKPGDVWGGSAVLNPSYFAPAYYRAFAAATGNRGWERVASASYDVMERVVARHSTRTGLQPEWATAAGDSAAGRASDSDDGFEFDYGYNAARVPWRLAMDAAWSCEPRARRLLARMERFFASVGPSRIRDGYRLDGSRPGRWRTAAFVAPAMTTAMFSEDPEFGRAMWDETVELRGEGYYHDSLRLLSLLLASGRMPPPGVAVGGAGALP